LSPADGFPEKPARHVLRSDPRARGGTGRRVLKDNPGDGEGWATLARSYNVLGRFNEAAAAYEKAISLLPADAQLLADYADALAMSQGQKLDGKPFDIIQRALKADPANLKALALAGTAAFERKDYRGAVGYWEKVVQGAPADSEFSRSIGSSLEEAPCSGGGQDAGCGAARDHACRSAAIGQAADAATVSVKGEPGAASGGKGQTRRHGVHLRARRARVAHAVGHPQQAISVNCP